MQILNIKTHVQITETNNASYNQSKNEENKHLLHI